MYVRALTAEQINDAVSDDRIDQRVTSARVDELLSNARIDQRVTSARVDALLSNARIDQRVTSARVNELVDRGFIKTGRLLIAANSEASVDLGALVAGAVASFSEIDDVETACGVVWSGNSITIRNSSGSQQNVSYFAVVSV